MRDEKKWAIRAVDPAWAHIELHGGRTWCYGSMNAVVAPYAWAKMGPSRESQEDEEHSLGPILRRLIFVPGVFIFAPKQEGGLIRRYTHAVSG